MHRNKSTKTLRYKVVGLAFFCAFVGCSPPVSANVSDATSTKDTAMTSRTCANDPLSRSACMIAIILDDVKAHFAMPSGGGISNIKATSSTSYTVSLPREERLQVLAYEFEVREGTITLKHRSESAQSF